MRPVKKGKHIDTVETGEHNRKNKKIIRIYVPVILLCVKRLRKLNTM